MHLRGLSWPLGAQVVVSVCGLLLTSVVYWTLPAALAADYFALHAGVALLSIIGGFGQRRLLPRDLRASRPSSQFGLIASRFKIVLVAAALCAATAGALVEGVVASAVSPALRVALGAWVFSESIRGVASDALLGFLDDRGAAIAGDALRWIVHTVLILVVLQRGSLNLLAFAGSAASAAVAVFALYRLYHSGRNQTALQSQAFPIANIRVPLRSGAVVMLGAVSAALVGQLSVVIARLRLADEAAADYAFVIRIAAGTAIFQIATSRYVLPRAPGLADNRAEQQRIRRLTRIGASLAALLLGLGLAALATIQSGSGALLISFALVGLGYLANVSAGPAETVLVANGFERSVLASNVVFGLVGVAGPLVVGRYGLTATSLWIATSISLHHGNNAALLQSYIGTAVGLWRLPAWLYGKRRRSR